MYIYSKQYHFLHVNASSLVVTSRNAETLIPIIKKHMAAGSVIYTDRWKGYFLLEGGLT